MREGGDDGPLVLGEVGLEAQRAHALDEQPVVLGVPRRPRAHAALLLQLAQGLGEGEHRVGGRGEAPLPAVALHGLPLGVQVERQAARLAAAAFQQVATADGEGEAGHPLDALVRAAHDEVDAPVLHGDVDAAEAGHGVDDERRPCALGHGACGLDVVDQARRRFVVHHGHVRDGGVGGQVRGDALRVDGGVVGLGVHGDGHARLAADLGEAVAVGAVRADEHALVVADHARQHGFVAERAAALHEHGRVALGRDVGEAQQVGADVLRDAFVVVVPGAVVEQHLLLHRARGGERAGRQQLVGKLQSDLLRWRKRVFFAPYSAFGTFGPRQPRVKIAQIRRRGGTGR